LRELAQGIAIEIDPNHNFFLVNGRRDIYLAMLLTTLKAYLVSILEQNGIPNSKDRAAQLILDGKIIEDFIHIEIPPEIKNGSSDNQWKIFMTVEGSHKFFMDMVFP
jgi:hypothetical protein